jgi:hypothetical protein
MVASTFDDLARTLTSPGSRRRTFGAVLGGALSLALGASSVQNAAAKKKCPPCKKRKNGKCKKTLPDGTDCPGGTCQSGSCVAGCPPARVCGNGCCPDGQICQQGQCAAGGNGCPNGQRPCGTACLLAGQCCTATDCPTGITCCGRLCVDTTTDPRHCGGCATPCSAGKTCAGGRCCTARGDDCTPDGECCGTDFCDDFAMNVPQCRACLPKDGECRFKTCCPGLFCVFNSATGEERCVSCKPRGLPCQGNAECCAGLFCQSGSCAEPGTD